MGYVFSVNQVVTAGTFVTITYNHVMSLIATLLSAGWTCKGSSNTGAYSTTPDGVDRWTGGTAAGLVAVSTSDKTWYVAESPSGLQVCFEIAGTFAALYVTVSKNKLNVGNAWRTSPAALSRPTDTSSSPIGGREFTMAQSVEFLPGGTGGVQYQHNIVRDDGEGFIVSARRSVDSGNTGGLLFLGKLTAPEEGDDNPYVIYTDTSFAYRSSNAPSGASDTYWGRVGSSVVQMAPVLLGGSSTTSYNEAGNCGPDPFSGKETELPFGLWTNAGSGYVRMSIPDMYTIRSAGSPSLPYATTLNARNRLIHGCFTIPWDGSTDLGGADYPSQVLPLTAVQAGGSGGRLKSLNLGLEGV